MKFVFVFLFLIINMPILSQCNFPLDKWNKYSIVARKTMSNSGNSTYSYHSFKQVDTIIRYGKKYCNMNFVNSAFYMRFDSSENKIYVFHPAKDSEYIAFDFNLEVGEYDTTWLPGFPVEYQLESKRQKIFGGVSRTNYDFFVAYAVMGFEFLDGIGLYYTHFFGMTGHEYYALGCTLNGLILDTVKFNPIIARIDTTNLGKEMYIDMFPFILKITGEISNPNFGSEIKAEFNVFRSDTLVKKYQYYISPVSLIGTISINQNGVMVGDSVTYKLKYKDASIFANNFSYPDTGYYYFKVLDFPNSIKEESTSPDKFELYNAYPNPFNPSTVISYQIPVNSKVLLKLYDILGREIATLVDKEQLKGRHEVKYDASGLACGVYIYKLKVGDFIQSKKMNLIK